MRRFAERYLLEWFLQLRSIWTVGAVGVLLAVLVAGSFSTFGFIRSMQPTLAAVEQREGSAFAGWVARDAEAAPFRNDLAGIQPNMGPNLYLAILGAVGPLIATIWAASVVGAEFGRRTVRLRAAHDGWRASIAAKHVMILSAVLVCAVAAPLLGVVAGRFTWMAFARQMPALSTLSLPQPEYSPITAAAVVVSGVLFYALLGSAIALITRSTAAGIVGGLAIPYLEGLAGQWWLPQAAYGFLLKQSLAYHDGAFVNAPAVPHAPSSVAVAVGVMAVWLLAVVVGSQFVASRQEIS